MKGDDFKNRRERLGLSQAKLAELVDLSISAVSKWENDKMPIPRYMDFVFEALEARKIRELQGIKEEN